jgi:hypothetical protein
LVQKKDAEELVMRLFVGSVVTILSVVCICSSAVERERGQNPKTSGAAMEKREQTDAEAFSKKMDEKIRKESEAEQKFLANYVSLPPQERVRLWRKGRDVTGRGLIQAAIDNALIAVGVDAAPYLAEIVRNGDSYHRAYALKILCDMDRFVPLEKLPVPQIGRSTNPHARAHGLEGKLNRFMIVDGRRIGREGYEAVRWAAEQTKDKDLRFHARQYSGLLEQDLRRLTFNEQIKQWRDAVAKSKGVLGADIDSYNLSYLLKAILIERAPESIPTLIEILERDSNEYVREEALTALALIDTFRMRLRATETGKKAIEAIHMAAGRGGLKPVHTTQAERESLWKQISAQVFNDEVDIFMWDWAVALKQLYGVPLALDDSEVFLSRTLPELRRFVSFLTKVDPYYPSWEFTFVGDLSDTMLHPLFKAKMARYYEQWKRFKAERVSSPSKP